MAYADFLAAIQSEALRAIAEHWHTARGERLMPGWNDIQPSRITTQLKLIWVYKYDRATRLFTGRLAGNVIETVFGRSFRGTPMSELYPPHDYERLHGRAERVVCEPALFRGDGRVFVHFERIGNGERIMLPLADDGVTGDGVLGATIYQPATGFLSPDDRENEYWYPL
jgi:hypothetical protein